MTLLICCLGLSYGFTVCYSAPHTARLKTVMPAAMAAAVASGHMSQARWSSPPRMHSSTLEGKGPHEGSCGPATAYAAAALAGMVVAQADSGEGAAAGASAAQAIVGGARNTGSIIIHPPPPKKVICAASASEVEQRPSASGPSSTTEGSSIHHMQEQAGNAAADLRAAASPATSSSTTNTAAAAEASGTAGGYCTPFATPPLPLDIPASTRNAPTALSGSESIEAPSYLGPSCLDTAHPIVADSPDVTGPLAAAEMGTAGACGGVGAVGSSGLPGPPSPLLRQRQPQRGSGSFSVIREGQPLEDATVPVDLGSRQSSFAQPLSSNSSLQQDGTSAASSDRQSLPEGGGGEGAAMQRQGSPSTTGRLRTPFAIMTQAPPSQPILIPMSRGMASSTGKEAYVWPFGQSSSSGAVGGLPLVRKGSGVRSGSVELNSSQLTPVASSGRSGSWHGGAEKAPVVGVRCKMLQTSK
jgi:hypothetical protein